MDVSLNLSENVQIDKKTFLKMNFLYNAINEGWTVTKNKQKYVFTKNHNGKKEVFSDEYLDIFINTNLIINRKISNLA
jgi:hypothetical protein